MTAINSLLRLIPAGKAFDRNSQDQCWIFRTRMTRRHKTARIAFSEQILLTATGVASASHQRRGENQQTNSNRVPLLHFVQLLVDQHGYQHQ
jgi:hypothetical protein